MLPRTTYIGDWETHQDSQVALGSKLTTVRSTACSFVAKALDICNASRLP
jgi:hypothetical protein